MLFYSLKHRRSVEVPRDAISGRVVNRTTQSGATIERYLLVAEATVDGAPVKLTKFVKRGVFEEYAEGAR